MAEKLRRIDDIGGPDTHSNFPQGWAMAANTPLKRYKQNTHDGCKAVAYHAPGTPFAADRWELLSPRARDFAENADLAQAEPERLAAMQALWWQQAQDNQVLPLDERFGARFARERTPHAGGRDRSSCSTPAWATCPPTWRPTCVRAATRSRPR